MTITLVIPREPPVSLNTQLTMHWRKRYELARMYADETFATWYNADCPGFTHPRITINCYYKGNKFIKDRDNGMGSIKCIVDALKGRAWEGDDTTEDIDLRWFAHVDNISPRIEIVLEEDADRG